MAGKLDGKVVLITGTGGGQGRSAALRFAAEGAIVMGCDLKEDGNRETVERVAAAGGQMVGKAPVDLGDPDETRAWVEESAEPHGRIDVLYNNASKSEFGTVGELSVDAWRSTIRNELDCVFFAIHAAWPYLIAADEGVVINTASVSAWSGSGPGVLAHCATKGGVLSLTRALAVEGKAHGIRAVSISPGPIETPGTAAMFDDPAVRGGLEAASLVNRVGRPDDVAATAVFLASAEASFITGADVLVDGGMRAL